MSRKRVVVTGLGMVSSVGHNVEDTWQAILAGKSGVSPISSFDVSSFATQISASVRDLDITPYLDAKEARKLDLFIQYGMAAGVQAMTDSGLQVDEANAGRYGCVIGSGIGGLVQLKTRQSRLKSAVLAGFRLFLCPAQSSI